MALPTITVRRVLEELVAYGLAKREPQGQGKPDLWRWIDWNRPPPKTPKTARKPNDDGAFQRLEGTFSAKPTKEGKGEY